MSFALDINKFVKKCGENADQVTRNVMFKIMKSIDEKSPVGNPDRWQNPDAAPEGYAGGHFRGNWQLGVDSMPTGIVEGIDPSGSATLSKAHAAIPIKAAGHVFYYANNLPYAQALEDGHSTIAPGPNAIVGRTAVEFQSIVGTEAEKLK